MRAKIPFLRIKTEKGGNFAVECVWNDNFLYKYSGFSSNNKKSKTEIRKVKKNAKNAYKRVLFSFKTLTCFWNQSLTMLGGQKMCRLQLSGKTCMWHLSKTECWKAMTVQGSWREILECFMQHTNSGKNFSATWTIFTKFSGKFSTEWKYCFLWKIIHYFT